MKGIYKITTLHNNKIYIGSSSKDIKFRFYSHLSLLKRNKHHSPYLQHVYNKYGISDFQFSIIEDLSDKSKEFIINREQYYLDKYQSYSPENGYNVSILAICNTDRYIKILQYDMKGNYLKTWNSALDLAKKLQVTVGSIYACCNRVDLISVKNYQLRYENDKRPVENKLFLLCCYDLKGNFLKSFNGYKDASKYYNIKLYSNIRRAALYEVKCKNMYWKIYNIKNFPKIIIIPKQKRGKKVKQIDKNGNLIAIYNSATDAAKSVNSSIYSISRVLTKMSSSYKTLKGYKWEYV